MLFQSNEQCGRNSLQSSQPNTSMSINIVRSFQVRHSFQNLFILKKNHILDIFIDQSWRQMSDTITINTNILIGRWVQLLFQNPIHANHFADDKTIFNYRKVRSVDFDKLSKAPLHEQLNHSFDLIECRRFRNQINYNQDYRKIMSRRISFI